MITDSTISAEIEYYTCMVGLLGHACHLWEAEDMNMAMSCKQNVTAWMILLDSCRIHVEVEMAECIAK
jgi:hypothetical protein